MANRQYTQQELLEWMIDKAEQAKTPDRARKEIASYDSLGRSTAMIGRMYFFKYNAKGKNYLPKFDRFPLVFPLERYSDGFLGINLHYLNGGQRQALVTELMVFTNNKLMDPSTKLLIDYDILESVGRLQPLTRPCYKRYLFSHVQSKFIEIFASEYDKAIQLPVENWHYKK